MRGGATTFALNGTHTSAVVRVNDSIQKLACVSTCVCVHVEQQRLHLLDKIVCAGLL